MGTRFKVTKSRLNSESFDMEMNINLHDMEVVAIIKEEEKALTCQEDKEVNKTSLSSKDKVESGVYVPSRPPKKPGGKEADEVDITTECHKHQS